MVDPLAEIVTLLQPHAAFSKLVTAAGPWRVRRDDTGNPFYLVILDGSCRLAVDGQPALTLQAGDFVLIPSTFGKTTSSLAPAADGDVETLPVKVQEGEFRLGPQDVPAELQMLVGHCRFASPDAGLLVSLLPGLVLVRGQTRLTTLVQLVREESRAARPAREMVLSRLLEVLFIEALRSGAQIGASPGLMRGLADDRLAAAIRRMHEDPRRAWTIADLAKEAALSRSAFFARFTGAVGMAPMEYLLAWRMALGKSLLRRNESVSNVATQVGYGSASAFSVAFTRHVGMPPARYAQGVASAEMVDIRETANPNAS